MSRMRKTVLAGTLATVGCLSAVAWIDAEETAVRRQERERDTRVVALQLASRVRGGLEKQAVAMQQMARFFEGSEEVTQQEFYDFAASTLKLTPLCLRIPLLDSSLRVRWVHPYEPNQSLVGFDAKAHQEGYEAAQRAIRTRALALSSPLTLVGGARGFVLTTPIFRDDGFYGALVCSIRSTDFFRAMALSGVTERYEATVTDSGMDIFTSGSKAETDPFFPGAVEQFTLGGRTWRMEVSPRPAVYLAQLHSGRAAYWILGCLVTLALGVVVSAGTYRASGIAHRLKTQTETLDQTRARLEGAHRQLLEAEKLSALGELVAGVAHEINNPLAGVLGYTQLVLREELPPEIRRKLDTVCSEAERAGRIVRNLLTFARKHPPERTLLGLNGIIEKTLELKAYHFKVSQIRVEKDFLPDLPRTMLDFYQIQQVLLNLLNNAEQAMAETGRGGVLRLRTRLVGGRIELRVSDSGAGISPEHQGRIFEPFFTTKKEGKGTGLGLSLCYGIVQEHGGTIRAESEPGRGSTFVIELPVTGEAKPVVEAQAEAAPEAAARLSILVIDDEPGVQGLLVDLLAAAGHRVDTASDVPEALRKIGAGGHDLIISDMKMPSGTGKDIYQAVAARTPHLAQRIIFTSGDGASEEALRFTREMGREILLKPYRLEEIERVVSATTKG